MVNAVGNREDPSVLCRKLQLRAALDRAPSSLPDMLLGMSVPGLEDGCARPDLADAWRTGGAEPTKKTGRMVGLEAAALFEDELKLACSSLLAEAADGNDPCG